MYSLVSLLSGIYPVLAMHSLLVTLFPAIMTLIGSLKNLKLATLLGRVNGGY